MGNREFKALFCERFGYPPSEYERRAFSKCLYGRAKLIAPVLLRLKPDFFAEDFNFIRCMGESTDVREVGADLLNFQDVNRGHRSFLRTGLKIRVSGRKARRLAQQLFAPDSEAEFQTR